MMSSRQRCAAIATLVLAAPAPASAQLLDRYFPSTVPRSALGALPTTLLPEDTTVASRQRPEYDFGGVRLGSFLIRPRGAESVGYDDNIFGQTNKRGAATVRSEGGIDVSSNWSRHGVYAGLGIDDVRFIDQPRDTPSQSRTNWNAAVGGALQVGRDLLTGSFTHLRQHQERTDIEGGLVADPLPFDVNDFRIAYRSDFGRISLAPDLVFQTTRYGDDNGFLGTIDPDIGGLGLGGGSLGGGASVGTGGALVGTFSPLTSGIGTDRNVIDGGITARYTLSPLRDLVAVGRGSHTKFLESGRATVSRDATTFSGLGGFDDSSGGLVGYRILAGVQVRNFEDPALRTRTRPIVEAAITYSPTRLTTFGGLVSRRLEDAAAEASSGYTFTQARLSVDHEYLRNVILSGYAQYLQADFIEGDNNKILGGGAKATWLLNRNMRVALTYDYADRSAGRGLDFSRNVALVRLEFGL